MESRAKLAGHAIHPMLITLPLGLLGTAVIFDIIRAFSDEADLAVASSPSGNTLSIGCTACPAILALLSILSHLLRSAALVRVLCLCWPRPSALPRRLPSVPFAAPAATRTG